MSRVLESPVEVTTRYVTSVGDLAGAWAFVMARLESVGPDPEVSIKPVWIIGDDDHSARYFEVVVSGMVQEKTS